MDVMKVRSIVVSGEVGGVPMAEPCAPEPEVGRYCRL